MKCSHLLAKIFLLVSVLLSASAFGGIFGSSDGPECMMKYRPILKFSGANTVLIKACFLAYDDHDMGREFKKSGRCIVNKVSEMYSYETSLRIISKCSGDNVALFNAYKSFLDHD